LLLGKHPEYTPADLRGVLKAATEDLGTTGSDAFGWKLLQQAGACEQPAAPLRKAEGMTNAPPVAEPAPSQAAELTVDKKSPSGGR
jgi:hypothetical protein